MSIEAAIGLIVFGLVLMVIGLMWQRKTEHSGVPDMPSEIPVPPPKPKPNMVGLDRIRVIREYCDYVERHLINVDKAWNILKKALATHKVIWDDHLFWEIDRMILGHDLSKFSAEEFIAYAEWFRGPHGNVYNVQLHGDKSGEVDLHLAKKAAFDAAWDHHKAHNPHHWQTWPNEPKQFPNQDGCHLVCMVADWMAMGMEFGDTAEEYYEKNKDKIDIPQWADVYLADIFAAIRKHNEDAT